MAILKTVAEHPQGKCNCSRQYSTFSDYRDTNASRCSLGLGSDCSLVVPLDSEVTEIWIHWHGYKYYSSCDTSDGFVGLQTGTGFEDPLCGIKSSRSGDGGVFFYVNGALVGDNVCPTSGQANYDLYIKYDTNGEIKFYKNDSLLGEYYGDTTTPGVTGGNSVAFRNGSSQYYFPVYYVSQIIIADSPTIGKRLVTIAPNANGDEQDFTGDYTDIDEFDLDTNDNIFTNTVSNTSTFQYSNIDATFADWAVEEVRLISSVRNTADSAVADGRHIVRIDGVDYESADLNTPADSSVVLAETQYTNNPATGSSWTRTEVDSAQFGIKTI
jgi:hypothetical protein